MKKLPGRLSEHVHQVVQINRILLADIGRSLDSLKDSYEDYLSERSEKKQLVLDYHLKTVIRCFLGSIDATAYRLRQAVLDCAPLAGINLTTDERKSLKKVRNPRGSLNLAYRHFASLANLDMQIDQEEEGWRAFANLVDTRNGFSHPEDIRDLFATQHFGSLRPALAWYPQIMSNLFNQVTRAGGADQISKRMDDVIPPIMDLPVQIGEIFDDEFFKLLGEDAGRSIRYLQLSSRKLEGETSLAMKEAHLDSRQMSEASQYSFRNLARALFSNIEGYSNFFRAELHRASERGELTLIAKDIEAMTQGSVEERAAATARVWSREVGYGKQPSTQGKAWKAVEQSRGLRNRLTHPRNAGHLRFDLKSAGLVLTATGWYVDEILGASFIDSEKWAGRISSPGKTVQ